MSNYGFVRIATATPRLRVADVDFNVAEIVHLSKQAAQQNVEFLVFPELSITAYTCADLFFQQQLHKATLEGLNYIVEETRELQVLIAVGLPIRLDNQLFNSAALLCGGKLLGIVPKSHIPGYKEFYEPRWFAAANRAISREVELFGQTIPFGSNLLFKNQKVANFVVGVEICEDLWMPIPPSSHMVLEGASIIGNLSASNETVGKADYRRALVIQQSGRGICSYAYSSCGVHESTTDVVFSGHSMIAENGSLLAESEMFRRDSYLIIADVDVEKLMREREMTNSFGNLVSQDSTSYHHITFHSEPLKLAKTNLKRKVDPHPFVPNDDATRDQRCKVIFNIQAAGLAKRLEHLYQQFGMKQVTIGISGGLDSTLALLVAVKAYDLIGLDRRNILAVTMPGFGTTDRTRSNAIGLCEALGVFLKEISITASVLQHFADIAHNPEVHNITYENAQARMRTMILMDLGFVVGTGDLSELALGWCTYNGDHMSMYAVNAGVPKTLVKHLVRWVADTEMSSPAREVLHDILDTPISPELLPPDKKGNIVQKTEDIIGPYELIDFFIFQTVRNGFEPSKTLFLAEIAFGQQYSHQELQKWLEVFYVRFFSQQFKRSCIADGPKVGSVSLSPRGDLR
ncbi:MAG: NAD(+) synthase, partial [Blastocatellia bacterium]|nr:NAD(+) synthase [Blastocatellia bacterium]